MESSIPAKKRDNRKKDTTIQNKKNSCINPQVLIIPNYSIPSPNDLLRFTILGFGIAIVILGTLIILFSKGVDTSFEFIGICLVYRACFSGAIYSFFQKSLFVKFHPIEEIAYCIWFGTAMLMIYSNQAAVELVKARSIKHTSRGIYRCIS